MNLHFQTVTAQLKDYLYRLMQHPAFDDFYLAGGTALSLQLGHRTSVDIDFFTDKIYGTLDLVAIKKGLEDIFPHIRNIATLEAESMVQTLFVGDSAETEIKLDMCYDERLIDNLLSDGKLRIASIKDIGAMKINAIVNGDRRKDYWDVHELMQSYKLDDIVGWGMQKYPYSLSRNEILEKIYHVWDLDDQTDVVSLKDGVWDFVADDLCEEAKKLLIGQ